MHPLVLFPGAGGRAAFWQPVADRLGDLGPTQLLAWPGFGDIPADSSIESLQQEAGDVADQGAFYVALVGLIAEAQEIEMVGVSENFLGKLNLGLGQALGEVGHCRAFAQVELGLDVGLQGRAGPGTFDGADGVPFALVGVRGLGQQRHDVEPGQLVSRLLTNLKRRAKLGENPHIFEVRCGKAPSCRGTLRLGPQPGGRCSSEQLVVAGSNGGGGASSGATGARDGVVTCTFGGLLVNGAALSSYTESGITVVATAGGWQAMTGYGNPAPSIDFVTPAGVAGSEQVKVTAGGSAFSFASVDLYSSVTPIPYTFTGLMGSTTVFSVSGTVPNTFGAFATVANPNAEDLIDTLVIELTNDLANGPACCDNTMSLDNVRLIM